MRQRLTAMLTAGSLLALAGAASARPVFNYAGPPVPIPDAGPGDCLTSPPGAPASVDINVPVNLTIQDLNVGMWITHTWQADLQISITHVDTGMMVMMVDRAGNPTTPCGFSVDNFGASTTGLFIEDDGALNIYDEPAVATPGMANVIGHWKPESPLSVFNGTNAHGTWRLSVVDNANADVGSINFVSLDFLGGSCYPDCDGNGVLNINDFICFQTKFALGDPYADCDGNGLKNINDFICFQTKFALGC